MSRFRWTGVRSRFRRSTVVSRCLSSPCAVVLLAVVVFAAALAGTASGDTPTRPLTVVTLTFTPTPTPGQASPLATITCDLTIDYPHSSKHVPETVNVVAHWNCTQAMSSLEMDVQLDVDNIQIGSGHSENTLQRSLNGNAAANGCINGAEYEGYVSGSGEAPPGYSPRLQTGYNSSSAEVTC